MSIAGSEARGVIGVIGIGDDHALISPRVLPVLVCRPRVATKGPMVQVALAAGGQGIGDRAALVQRVDVVDERDLAQGHIARVGDHEAEVDGAAGGGWGPGGVSASCQVVCPSTETNFSRSMAGRERAV